MAKEMKRDGDCYKVAYQEVYRRSHEPNIYLVHGTVMGQGKVAGIRYSHAWVEKDGDVIDKTIPLFANGIAKEVYYHLGRVDEDILFKYTPKEMYEKAFEFKHYGPWEDILWEY